MIVRIAKSRASMASRHQRRLPISPHMPVLEVTTASKIRIIIHWHKGSHKLEESARGYSHKSEHGRRKSNQVCRGHWRWRIRCELLKLTPDRPLELILKLFHKGSITAAALKAENCFDRIRIFERRETAGGTWSVKVEMMLGSFDVALRRWLTILKK